MRSVEAVATADGAAPFSEAVDLHALVLRPEMSAIVAWRGEIGVAYHRPNVAVVAV